MDMSFLTVTNAPITRVIEGRTFLFPVRTFDTLGVLLALVRADKIDKAEKVIKSQNSQAMDPGDTVAPEQRAFFLAQHSEVTMWELHVWCGTPSGIKQVLTDAAVQGIKCRFNDELEPVPKERVSDLVNYINEKLGFSGLRDLAQDILSVIQRDPLPPANTPTAAQLRAAGVGFGEQVPNVPAQPKGLGE